MRASIAHRCLLQRRPKYRISHLQTPNHISYRNILSFICAALVSFAGFGSASADTLTSGNFQTGTPTPTFAISTPFTFNINTTGSFQIIDLDEWVTSDGTATSVAAPSGQTLLYQINGGAVQSVGVSTLYDNEATTFSPYTPNDGLLILSSPIPVSTGQSLTILAGSFTFSSNANFNPSIPKDFAGSVFAVSNAAIRLSANTSVPEPSIWSLMAICGICLAYGGLRRRSRAQLAA